MAATALAAAAAAASVVGCASSSTPPPANSSSAVGTPATVSSYPTVAELAKALNDKGIACKLSYAGLKDDATKSELSICTIDDEQATLRVWQDPTEVTKFLASPDGQTGLVAVGGNWMISFQTPATASRIAETMGATAPGANAAGASTTSAPSTTTP